MADITITFPDKKQSKYPVGTSGLEIAKSIGSRLAKDALAVKVSGILQDLSTPINQDSDLAILTWSSKEGQEVFRHSTAHIFAYAIQELYPDSKNTIGPAVDEGFYYDFDDLNITEADFPKIEAKMKEIIAKDIPFQKHTITLTEVKARFPKNNYKIEMATEFEKQGPLTSYSIGSDLDLVVALTSQALAISKPSITYG